VKLRRRRRPTTTSSRPSTTWHRTPSRERRAHAARGQALRAKARGMCSLGWSRAAGPAPWMLRRWTWPSARPWPTRQSAR
jgi:hypothetical protein